MACKIKTGDTVMVIAGRDKGKQGKVKAINHKTGRATVEGVGIVSKHAKPSQSNPSGGILQMESPIDLSNVMYVHDGRPTRIGFKMDGDRKVRFAKSTGEVVD